MLAGLLFATHDAEDRAGVLAATLPFGGLTLIEYQARLLVALGATQIIVVVQRLTPELLGAVARIGRRGVAVDPVRSAGEAIAKVHPLARVLMLADGLVTTEAVLAPLAAEGGDTLLTLDGSQSSRGLERLGGHAIWAGAARLQPARMAEVAAMPRDYDMQSALVRVAAQAHASQLMLSPGMTAAGHGVERSGAALDARGREVMASVLAQRRGWFDRWLVTPVAKPLLGEMMRRASPSMTLAGATAAVGACALTALALGQERAGMVAITLGAVAARAGRALAWLRDEVVLGRAFETSSFALPALATLLLGRAASLRTDALTGLVLAVTLIVLAGLDARIRAQRTHWQGDSGSYLTVSTIATLVGWPLAGLAIAAGYAAVSLATSIEVMRRNA